MFQQSVPLSTIPATRPVPQHSLQKQNMQRFAFVVLAFSCLLFVAAEKEVGPFLVSIGTVEGKEYFYDSAVSYSWNTGKSFCVTNGMRLAQIETSVQQTFLQSKYNSTGFSGFYWFGVREEQSTDQFVSDLDGSPVLDVGQTWAFTTPQSCLMYYATSGANNGRWTSFGCNQANRWVLCERSTTTATFF